MAAVGQLHPKDAAAVDRVVARCREAGEKSLLAVALYGEAAGAGYRERHTPLATVAVFSRVSMDVLRHLRRTVSRSTGLRDYLPHWWRPRTPVPLLMDPDYIERSRDVFPLEFLQICDQHVMLWGEVDPFSGIEINRTHLRLEVEEQIKGKLLHLRTAYLETGRSQRRLRHLMLESVVGFEIILRGMLFLAGAARADRPAQLLRDVEERFDVSLPTLQRLRKARNGLTELDLSEIELVFASYLDQVVTLATITDAL